MHHIVKTTHLTVEKLLWHQRKEQNLRRIKGIKVLTRVIHGGQGIIFPPIRHVLAITQLISNTHVEIIPEMGHYISNYFVNRLYEI